MGGLRAPGFPCDTAGALGVSTLTFPNGEDNGGGKLSCTTLFAIFHFSLLIGSLEAVEFTATPCLANAFDLSDGVPLSTFTSVEHFGEDKEPSYEISSFLIWSVESCRNKRFRLSV